MPHTARRLPIQNPSAAAYYLAAVAGLQLALVRGQVTPLWPPTGIALVSLLLLGPEVCPGITIGALLLNLQAFNGSAALAALLLAALIHQRNQAHRDLKHACAQLAELATQLDQNSLRGDQLLDALRLPLTSVRRALARPALDNESKHDPEGIRSSGS
jgi:integral membrane sensor domain MASE1